MYEKFWGVFTEDGLDQTVETLALANVELADLLAMGYTANLHRGEQWALDIIDEYMRDGLSFKTAVRYMMRDHG